MKSLAIFYAIVAVSAVAAEDKAQGFAKQEKRHAYNNGAVQPPQQPATPGSTNVPNNVPVQPYQPDNNSYQPTCVIRPYAVPSFPVYQPPYTYGPAESSYVPQYQPARYPVPYQPSQYPVPYQPSQYPVPYQPSQYPIPYQPSQYPIPYQPSQYPIPYQYPVAYQPSSQYPVVYQPSSQYPSAGYQPQQSPNSAATPYSYSYFTSSANNNAENVPSSNVKK